jgi:hypothetical protein
MKAQTYTRQEWKLLSPEEKGPCKLWTGTRNKANYGCCWWASKWQLAHRVTWIKEHGPILSDELCVLHHCDNPPCYEITHLWIGTRQDNSDDKIAKGREVHLRGKLNGMTFFTEKDVLEIRRLYAKGKLSQQKIAKIYGVGKSTIGRIIRRDSWWYV